MSKNIEKIKGEEALSEIVDITLDDAKLNGLVSNDVADMYQSASGLNPLKPIDAYESPIVELKANLKLIFRRLFSVPLTMLGSNKTNKPISIISMIEQMFNHYRERLKGSKEYGIPSRLSQLTDLPDAPALLADRKIGGVPAAPDGMSILQLLCTVNSFTELRDDNSYTITKPLPISLFPSVDTFTFGDNVDLGTDNIISDFAHDVLTVHGLRKQATQSAYSMFTGSFKKLYCDIREIDGAGILFNHATIEEMYLPKLEKANCVLSWNASGWWNDCSPNITTIQAPKLKEVTANYGTGLNSYAYKSCLIGAQCPLIKSLEFESLESISGNLLGGGSCPNITELRMPKLKRVTGRIAYNDTANRASLALIEVGAMETKLYLSWWNPTDKGATFLSNFKTYIAERLTDKGTGLTLTLSQEVRNAIHAAEDEYGIENIIITQKGWTISPAPN